MAVRAHGTLLKMGDGAIPVETFTTISEVLDIEGPGTVLSTVSFTPEGGGYPLVLPDGFEPGELTFEINYSGHETQHRLQAAIASQSVASFQMEFPTDPAETAAFSGYVTGFTHMAPVEGILRASVTITLASVLTFL